METLTPELIAENLRNHLTTPFDRETITVKGIYKKPDSHGVYGGYIYCKLFENDSKLYLTIKVHEKDFPRLQNNTQYELKGYFQRSVKTKVAVNFSFVVKEIVSGKALDLEQSTLSDLLAQKYKLGYKSIPTLVLNKLEQSTPIKLHIITGLQSSIISDVESGLTGVDEIVEITIQNTNLSDPHGIISELTKADSESYDLLAIVRGGGDHLEVFNHTDLVSTITNLSTPIITAIGHSFDVSHADMVADKYVATPTKLGQYLKEQCIDFDMRKKAESERQQRLQQRNDGLHHELNYIKSDDAVYHTSHKAPSFFKKYIKTIIYVLLGAIIGVYLVLTIPGATEFVKGLLP